MATKIVSKKLVASTAKIANVADLLLHEEGHKDLEIDEIHLTSKSAQANFKTVCNYVKENGEWVLRCKNVSV
jgi:hypothetical protein